MEDRIYWSEIPKELQTALLKAVRQVTYDLATDGCNYDKTDIVENIMSVFIPVGEIVSDVEEAQLEAIKDAARDSGQEIETYVPVGDFNVF